MFPLCRMGNQRELLSGWVQSIQDLPECQKKKAAKGPENKSLGLIPSHRIWRPMKLVESAKQSVGREKWSRVLDAAVHGTQLIQVDRYTGVNSYSIRCIA